MRPPDQLSVAFISHAGSASRQAFLYRPNNKLEGFHDEEIKNSPSVDEEDEANVLHTMTVRHRDPIENRIDELAAQQSWLLQSLKDWSWTPGEPFQDQTVLGLLMNLKMAANPCFENSAVRRAGVQQLNGELSRVDYELSMLAAERAIADAD